MKRFLAWIGALSLTATTTLTVVACGPQPENNVIFLMPGNVMTSTASTRSAYQAIIDDFNREENANSKIKVKGVWESGDPIQRRYNAKEYLPDLYVSYTDNVSQYALDPNFKDKVRDLEASVVGDDSIQKETFRESFWEKSFYDEGVVDHHLTVLPVNKSVYLSLLNKRVFLELVGLIFDDTANLQEKLGLKPSELFLKKTSLTSSLKYNENFISGLEKILISDTPELLIREFFKSSDNLLDFMKIYSAYVKANALNDGLIKKNNRPTIDHLYSYGLESPANKIFLEYSDVLPPSEEVDPGRDTTFFYNYNSIDPVNDKMNIILDNGDTEPAKNLINFFNNIRDLAQGSGTDSEAIWNGAMFPGRVSDSKLYAGTFFMEGTMLLTSGTSAALKSYFSTPYPDKGIDNPQVNRDKDLMILSTATKTGRNYNFLQQGAGIAGFKSTGPSASEKEIIVNKFLKYLLKPKVLNRLALTSGYLPSTKEALKIYEAYIDGTYDNLEGKLRENSGLNPDDFGQIREVFGSNKGDLISLNDNLTADLMTNFLVGQENLIGGKLNVMTTKANPLGSIIRKSIDDYARSNLFRSVTQFDFSKIFKQNEVDRIIKDKLPGAYSNTEIKFLERKNLLKS